MYTKYIFIIMQITFLLFLTFSKHTFATISSVSYTRCPTNDFCEWDMYQYDMLPANLDLCSSSPKCGDLAHMFCIDVSEPAEACNKFKALPMDRKRMQSIVFAHNRLRQRVAFNARRPAENMNALQWDPYLERMAVGWMNQCEKKNSNCTDICMFLFIDFL